MRIKVLFLLALCAGLTAAVSGCSRKAETNNALQKAADSLATAETTASPAPTPAQPAQPAQAAPAPAAAPAPVPSAVPGQQMNQALTAYKAGNLEDAVTRLQKLRATSTLTPQQRIALNDAMAAVMTEIYELASKGDARAIQAVRQYEQMQTQRR